MKYSINDSRMVKCRVRGIANPEKELEKILNNGSYGFFIVDGGRVTAKKYQYRAYCDVLFVVKTKSYYFAKLVTDNAKNGGSDISIWGRHFNSNPFRPFGYKNRKGRRTISKKDDLLLSQKMVMLEMLKKHKFHYYEDNSK